MPIRIYDLAKKLGLESKQVLAVAKELGIVTAKVPSSALDKITGQYLEEQVRERLKLPKAESAAPPGFAFPPIQIILADPPTPQSKPAQPAPPPQPQSATRYLNAPIKLPPGTHALPVTSRQSDGLRGLEPRSKAFERRIRQLTEERHPHCVLSNILLFHAERARFSAEPNPEKIRSDYAFEMDHLLHRATETKDVLTIVECKDQLVTEQDAHVWEVFYRDRANPNGPPARHNVLSQVERHAKALRAYVNPLSRGRRLNIEIIVVSSDPATPTRSREIRPWLTAHLMNEKIFCQALRMFKPTPLRVVQSDLLGLLRLGMPVAELGHPELSNAIAYIERCRRDLDIELFRAFEPTKGRWAINGSAGMGKSVLLAYSLFVLTTDRKVQHQGDGKELANFAEQAATLNLPPLGKRRVYAYALKEKQRQVLETLFQRFVAEYSPLAKDSDLGIRRASIRLWTGKIPDDCHVLVVDEAHDLSSGHAKLISAWLNGSPDRYLLVACDRHQKLRLVGRDENIIEGVSFSLKTKKLRLNYRNPFSVYAASLGLMFRWFAAQGPKVLPSKDNLINGFGFTVDEGMHQSYIWLSMRNDAHPANNWSDCVSVFPSCEAALARLRPFRLRPQDVLWVRFDDEDEHFNYEQLSCFTYHNLNSPESVDLADKYIKGQDFPIVVIEGFSEDMDAFDKPEHEQRMWQRRKELYVCASRATGFLFFISRARPGTTTIMQQEIERLVHQLAAPAKNGEFSRSWEFSILKTPESRRMDVFTDANESAQPST